MGDELFIFHVADGKNYKINKKQDFFQIYEQQSNGEFVFIDTVLTMESVKTFLKRNGYKGY